MQQHQPSSEEVQHALQVIQQASVTRGDSFDIGTEEVPGDAQFAGIQPITTSKVNQALDPRQLSRSMNISEKQAENLRSLIVGGGTGAVHRLLSKQIGDEPAAVIGALLSAWGVKKFLR